MPWMKFEFDDYFGIVMLSHKISTPTGTPVVDEKVKERYSAL